MTHTAADVDADIAAHVLAAPDAIAVVTRAGVTYTIATRGDWAVEQVVEGTAEHVHAHVADSAAVLLAERVGVVTPSSLGETTLCVSTGAYERARELAPTDDRRAAAALVADDVDRPRAESFVEALNATRVEVFGLAIDGRRFVGCQLSIVGDETTGRWLVPAPDAPQTTHVVLERVSNDYLLDELALIFGDC